MTEKVEKEGIVETVSAAKRFDSGRWSAGVKLQGETKYINCWGMTEDEVNVRMNGVKVGDKIKALCDVNDGFLNSKGLTILQNGGLDNVEITRVKETQKNGNGQRDNKSIVRQSSLKAAVKFLKGKDDFTGNDVFELAEKFENWVNRE